VQLDPRSTEAVRNLGETYQIVRRYDLSLRTFDKAVSINPDRAIARWERLHTMLASGASIGDVKQSLGTDIQAVGFAQIARAAVGPYATAGFAISPSFLLTADPAYQPEVERLSLPEVADTIGYYTLKAELYAEQHRAQLERAYLDSARAALEFHSQAQPDEASFHSQLGIIYARLGRKTDAVREGETGVRLLPVSREAWRGANLVTALALIYTIVGQRSDAMDRLEYVLSIPSQISGAALRSDPRWAPLRGEPRFERLVGR
jgi:tetratricopeptide (TPR) repeat protein